MVEIIQIKNSKTEQQQINYKFFSISNNAFEYIIVSDLLNHSKIRRQLSIV